MIKIKIPNFLSKQGSIRYSNTIGESLSPKVAKILIDEAVESFDSDTMRILDVASGAGTVSLSLARRFPDKQITGIDYSDAMAQQCKKAADQENLKNTHFMVMNANTIQFPEESFDMVLCNLAFPFFPKPKKSMSGILSVLKHQGDIVMSVPGRETWKEFFEVVEEVSGNSFQLAKPFLDKFNKAGVLAETMREVGFINIEETSHKIPYSFDNGKDVLAFFQKLFSLLSYAPDKIKSELVDTIDKKFPNGFTMNYEAIIVRAARP